MTDSAPPQNYFWRRHNPGRVLDNALRRFEDRVMELLREAGHVQTRRSHVNLTRHLDLEGTRITELARRAAMTNAAMTELIDQCESLALVERVPDPADGRARIVRFTPLGLAWLDAFGRAVERAQREMAKEVGKPAMAMLLEDIARYAAAADASNA
ncbi:MAG: MarR family transcriptional regulator [Burkholderiaceae bacterium]|jgi:DNA-binding MarR family transcriptional regulator|nr:MarR family transcriptional regulator [Burkholderiaceae bacterium]MDO9090847.1 MarR family transcriptional regulator [Burkholderiaceae bacterium]MDP1967575.1 MarR family transcriptional regulator [Burkholderiaceae bacterium]MDP3135419.1 MarR family transcriptional regulator [Burkholderiaceae bacterium]